MHQVPKTFHNFAPIIDCLGVLEYTIRVKNDLLNIQKQGE